MPQTNFTAIMIKLKRESYKAGMNCSFIVKAPKGYGMTIFVTKFKLRRNGKHRDKLEVSYLTNHNTLLKLIGHNIDEVPSKTILTHPNQNQLLVNFVSDSFQAQLANKGFKLVINLHAGMSLIERKLTNFGWIDFLIASQKDGCNEQLGLNFDCKNGYCIDKLLGTLFV